MRIHVPPRRTCPGPERGRHAGIGLWLFSSRGPHHHEPARHLAERTTRHSESAAPSSPTSTRPPDGPVPHGFRAQSVTFVSARTGWVLGSAPCASSRARRTTHDGGTHWRRVGVGAGVRALAASAGHAVAVVGSGPRYRLLRAPVGGDAWSSVASFRQADHDIVEGDLALSGASGWLVGQSSLYVTADGTSWSKMPNPCRGFSGGGGGGAWLTSTTDGVVACAGQGAAGSEEKAIYGSSDGGHAFTLLGRPPRGGDFNAVAANRRNTVIVAAASGASTLSASFDGGRHYGTVLELNNGGIGWRDLGFTTDHQGVVVESQSRPGRLFMTRDGGHHWQVVRFAAG
jgi:hypothetical protein